MPRKIAYLALAGLLLAANATTFLPIPLETQIQNSDGVIQGRLVKTSFKKFKTGEIVTESSFALSKVVGIPGHKIINTNNFKIIHPGGIWEGTVQYIPGAPKFKKGEETILLVNQQPYGFQTVNLALSQYSLFKKHSKTFLQNSVFPNHPKLGKIPLEEFNQLLEKKFGSPLTTVRVDRYIHKKDTHKKRYAHRQTSPVSRGRSLASVKSEQTQESSFAKGLLWPTILLILLGVISTLVTQFQRKYRKQNKK